MISADPAIEEFARLLDVAIGIAERIESDSAMSVAAPWVVNSAKTTVLNLEGFRDMALSGRLPRPSKGDVPQGTGLGLTRGVGEWTDSNDLLDAVFAAEEYYKRYV